MDYIGFLVVAYLLLLAIAVRVLAPSGEDKGYNNSKYKNEKTECTAAEID